MELQKCPLVKHEKILVPIDGSPNGDAALDQAISLAKSCASKLYVLTVVYQNPEYFTWVPTLEEKQEEEARELLEQARKKAAKESVSCETLFNIGEQPHEFIVQEAKEKQIDLIVMGSHGRTGLKKMLLGSVTAKVIGHAPCAVMVIPQGGN